MIVDRVAVKASAEMIVDPAGRHLVERQSYHVERFATAIATPQSQQQSQVDRMRKFSRAAKASFARVEQPLQVFFGRCEQRRTRRLGRRSCCVIEVNCSVNRCAAVVTSERRFFHASSTADSTWSKPGIPIRAWAENRCRRRTVLTRASGTRSSASHPGR